jgi:hypothetical protein
LRGAHSGARHPSSDGETERQYRDVRRRSVLHHYRQPPRCHSNNNRRKQPP